MRRSEAYKKGRQRALNMIENFPCVNERNQMQALCDAEKQNDIDQVLLVYNKIARSVWKIPKAEKQ